MSEVNNIDIDNVAGVYSDVKKIQIKVKRRELADYLVKLRGDGSGEVTFVFAKESHKFGDINDMLRLIEGHCNAVSYPQSQRKMRNWQ